jgi:alpha-amylase
MVYADDAEKFGEWPGTHEWVFEKGWLREFLEQLRDDEQIRTVHLSERLAQYPPLGRIYPPTASYPEMTVWALPTPARSHMEALVHSLEEDDPQGLLPYLRGGHWRGFLAKYPEVNRLHKRMLRVSRRYHELASRGVDHERLGQALRDLYRGQCNDAYWHGAFGGVYLPHLRRAVESFLIRAERGLDRLDRGHFDWERARRVDFDADGAEEIELSTPAAQVVVDPIGGRLLSWDLREACDNWVTVMQRHEEPFHASLRSGHVIRVGEDGLPLEKEEGEGGVATIHGAVRVKPGVEREDLELDRHSRVAGLLWVASVDEVVDDPRRIEDRARPLRGAWDSRIQDDEAACALRTEQEGLRIVQELQLSRADASLELRLTVEPLDGSRRLFAEWNLFVGHTGDDLEFEENGAFVARAEGDAFFEDGVEALVFRGGGERRLRVEVGEDARLHWAPVHTVSSSEAGLEKIGQGTCFLFEWEIRERTEIRLRLVPEAPSLEDEPLDPRSPR